MDNLSYRDTRRKEQGAPKEERLVCRENERLNVYWERVDEREINSPAMVAWM